MEKTWLRISNFTLAAVILSSQVCGCIATNGTADEEPCNKIKTWKFMNVKTSDWFWIGSGGSLAVLLGIFIIIYGTCWCCCKKMKHADPKAIKSAEHVYLPQPLTLKWAVIALVVILLQILQFLSALTIAILFWIPITYPSLEKSQLPHGRFIPEYAFLLQFMDASSFSNTTLKLSVFGVVIFAEISLLRIIIFRQSVLRFRARHCFTAFIVIHCLLITLSGLLTFGSLHAFDQLSSKVYKSHSLTLERIPWIQGMALTFFCIQLFELAVLILLRWYFRLAFHKKSLPEDATQKSLTEYTYDSCRTAVSNNSDREYGLIVKPVPFIINSNKGGILELTNGYDDQWLAVRILTRTPKTYNISPQKLLIPPSRKLSALIELNQSTSKEMSSKTLDNALLIEFYPIGNRTPFFTCNQPWIKPYICDRNIWKHKVVLVFYENVTE